MRLLTRAQLALGLGLHTGQMLIEPLGEQGQLIYTALEDTTHLATRLAQ